jgi:CBS domain-containing protein
LLEADLADQPVQTIMSDIVVGVDQDTQVKEAALLMRKKGYGCLIVVSGTTAMGIVTERDIVHKITAEGVNPSKVFIQDIMSTPLITVDVKATIRQVAEKMSEYGVRRIVVTEREGRLAGLVTAGDLAKWLAAQKDYLDPTLNAIARIRTGKGPYG